MEGYTSRHFKQFVKGKIKSFCPSESFKMQDFVKYTASCTSQLFGLFFLRVLSVLCSCLDTFLFLECRYRFQELLLQSQLDIRFDNG